MVAKGKTRPTGRPGNGVRRAADSADRAYAAIRQWIIEFKLKPEERINELQFAQALALSRTPVREALNRLASEGFLVFSPNRGFFCRSLDIADLVAVYELRSILERGGFELACRRASNAGIAALARFWADALRRYARGDPDEMLGLDEAFHRQLAELSGNHEIVRQVTAIDARIRFVRRIGIEHGPRHARMIGEHTRLVAALKARNAPRGMRILVQHISLSVEEAQKVLKEVLFRLYVSEPTPARRRAA
jgi:DNA-binding GntR family transcriptional regulator